MKATDESATLALNDTLSRVRPLFRNGGDMIAPRDAALRQNEQWVAEYETSQITACIKAGIQVVNMAGEWFWSANGHEFFGDLGGDGFATPREAYLSCHDEMGPERLAEIALAERIRSERDDACADAQDYYRNDDDLRGGFDGLSTFDFGAWVESFSK